MLVMGYRSEVGPFVVGALASLHCSACGHPFLKSYAFTVWVFAFVAASMFYPQAFMTWGRYDLSKLIVPLIQIIMFGMGTTLSLADFTRVLKMPWPVFIGFFLQFTIMPLVGFTLAKAFGFSNEIAAGVVLIGCCPSGVASNVMAYLAGGDVALSVTITSFTTLAAPIMTPLWMKVLAGAFVEVQFLKMMFDIINIIIVPIVAGLIAHRILYSRQQVFRQSWTLALMAAAGLLLAIAIGGFVPATLFQYGSASFQKGGLVVGLLLIAVVTLVKLVVSVWLKGLRAAGWTRPCPLSPWRRSAASSRSSRPVPERPADRGALADRIVHDPQLPRLSDGVLARAGDSLERKRLPDRGVRGRHAEWRHGLAS